MTNIEKIESLGYKFHSAENTKHGFVKYNIEVEMLSGERRQLFGHLDRPIYFGKDEIPATRREIIQYLFNPTEEEMCQYEHHYSIRTKNYLDAVKKNIGFVEYESFEIGGKMPPVKETDGLYCHIEEIRYDIDGFSEERYYFSKKPTDKDLTTVKEKTIWNFYFLPIGSKKHLLAGNAEIKCIGLMLTEIL